MKYNISEGIWARLRVIEKDQSCIAPIAFLKVWKGEFMKKVVLCLMLIILGVSTYAEETAPDVQKEFTAFFQKLPDTPTEAQHEGLYNLIMRECTLVVSEGVNQGASGSRFFSMLGLGKLPFPAGFYLPRTKGEYERKRDAIAALRKKAVFGLCLIKYAMNGTDAVPEAPVSKLARSILAVRLEGMYMLETATSDFELIKPHQEWMKRGLDELNKLYSYREEVQAEITRRRDLLGLEGEGWSEKLISWNKKLDAEISDPLQVSALLDWLYLNTPKDGVFKQHPGSLSDAVETPVFINKFVQPEFLSSSEFEWIEGTCRFSNASNSAKARLRYALQLFLSGISYEVTSQDDLKSCWYAASRQNRMEVAELLPPSVTAFSLPVRRKSQKYSRHIFFEKLKGVSRLKLVEEGEGGGAWFLDSTVPDEGKGEFPAGNATIFPLQFMCVATRLAGSNLDTICKKDADIFGILASTDFFEWHPDTFFLDEDPEVHLQTRFKGSLTYDFSPEGKENLLRGTMGSVFLKGSNLNPEAGRGLSGSVSPGIFHYFEKTRWQIYTIWDYNCHLKCYVYERPVCVVIVSPINEEPDKTIAGVYTNELTSMLHKCGMNTKYATRLWSAVLYEGDENNKGIFAKANSLSKDLSDTAEKRWEEYIRKMKEEGCEVNF